MAVVISLLNMKGGVGKTTLAVNLAWHLFSRKKQRVLIVDLDPQFNASQYMLDFITYDDHVKTRGTIADIFIDQPGLQLTTKKKKPSDITRVLRLEQQGARYIDILPSQLELAHVVKNPAQKEYKLQKCLEPMSELYDYIIIDCAPTDSVLTTMALTASNYLLIPMRPDRFSILGYANLVKTIEEFKSNSHDPNSVRTLGLVFTQVAGQSDVESESMSQVRAAAAMDGEYVFESYLPYSQTISRAIQDQTPIYQTVYARQTLKDNMANIVNEMQNRIDELS